MKRLQLLVVAAISAMGLMAYACTGAASATTLITLSFGSEPHIYSAGTTIHATLQNGTTTRLTDTNGNTIATCTASTLEMLTGNETGTWVSGSVLGFTWGNCSQSTQTTSEGWLEIMQTSEVNGEVVGRFNSVTAVIFGVNCIYGTGEGTKLGTLTGGEMPILDIAATLSKVSGTFLCPSTVRWDASYIVLTPHSLFVAN